MLFAIYNETGTDPFCFSYNHTKVPKAVSSGKRLHRSAEEASFDCTDPNITLSIIQIEPVLPLQIRERRSSNDLKRTVLDESQMSNEPRTIKNKNLPDQTIDSKSAKEIYFSPLLAVSNKKSIESEAFNFNPPVPLGKITETAQKTNLTEIPRNSDFIFQSYSPTLYNKETNFLRKNFSQEGVYKYQSVTSLLQKHLTNNKNIFCQMIETFSSYLKAEFEDAPDKYNKGELSQEEFNINCIRATKDVELFVEKLHESISYFYQLDRLRSQKEKEYDKIFSQDNLIVFLLSIVMNKNIYDTVYQLYRAKYQNRAKSYKEAFALLKTQDPHGFGVPDKISLNLKTLEYLTEERTIQNKRNAEFNNTICSEEFLDKNKRSQSHESIKIDSLGKVKDFIDVDFEDLVGRISEITNFTPFEKVIEKLLTLNKRRSPICKLETLIKTIDQIVPAIQEFYKELGLTFDENLKLMDFLPIILYVIAKSGLDEMSTHLEFIKNFTPKNMLESKVNEYIIIMDACFNCICNTNLQDGYNFDKLSEDFQNFFLNSISKIASLKQQPTTFENIS